MTRRPAPLLPPLDRADRALLVVIAILAALACGAGLSTRGVWMLTADWRGALESSMTVQTRVEPGQDPDVSAGRAADAARAIPGVAAAIPLSRRDAEALLAPWLGEAGAPDGVALPALVDVRLDRAAPASRDAIAAGLAAVGIEAIVDDHRAWSEPLARASFAARATAAAILLLLAAAAVAATVFATLAGLAARADVVEALYLVGARDEQIAREFTRRFFSLGLRAGGLGALAAAAAGFGLQAASATTTTQAAAFLPQVQLIGADGLILAAAPVLIALVSALAARFTVLRALRARF